MQTIIRRMNKQGPALEHVLLLGHFSRVQLFVIPWIVVCQALLSMEFSWQEYWSGFPFPSPEDFPHLVIKPGSPVSPALQTDSLRAEPLGKPQATCFSSVQFSCSVVSDSLRPHESQHARPSCPSPTPRVHSDSRQSSQ